MSVADDLTALISQPAETQLAWFRDHPGLMMRYSEWGPFYCASLEHKGLCCESCYQDEDYFSEPTFDDHCCCMGARA